MTGQPWRAWLRGKARVLWLWLGMALAAPSLWAYGVTDDRGVTVNFDKPPQRIVSLLPSLTETVCELGQCQRLVGVDRYSNYPSQVRQLPQLGGGLDPNLEAIVALRPDVVLMATSTRLGERLQSLGLKVVAMEPKTHADVQRVLITIGRLLDVSHAQQVWRDLDAGVVAAAQSLSATARDVRVYFEASQGPYGASEASFIGETLARLGVRNILPGELGPFPKINPEFVVRANPDLIMLSARSADGLAQRPGWHNIRALREQRVCIFSAEQADVLVRAGTRLADAARLMAKCLRDKAPAIASKGQP
jgi:iron complex transport system substrate-binding protein